MLGFVENYMHSVLWIWTGSMWSVKVCAVNCLKFFSSADGHL